MGSKAGEEGGEEEGSMEWSGGRNGAQRGGDGATREARKDAHQNQRRVPPHTACEPMTPPVQHAMPRPTPPARASNGGTGTAPAGPSLGDLHMIRAAHKKRSFICPNQHFTGANLRPSAIKCSCSCRGRSGRGGLSAGQEPS